MRSAARAFGREPLRMAAALPGAILLALLAAAPVTAQEIVRSEVHDLAVPEVEVTEAGALPSDRVQCLLRDAAGDVRVAGAQPVGIGIPAGDGTLVTIPLVHVAPAEREFAVSLIRADRELDRTVWRPVPQHH